MTFPKTLLLLGGSRYLLPVIVKPVDSAGSKGVTRVDEPAGLQEYSVMKGKWE